MSVEHRKGVANVLGTRTLQCFWFVHSRSGKSKYEGDAVRNIVPQCFLSVLRGLPSSPHPPVRRALDRRSGGSVQPLLFVYKNKGSPRAHVESPRPDPESEGVLPAQWVDLLYTFCLVLIRGTRNGECDSIPFHLVVDEIRVRGPDHGDGERAVGYLPSWNYRRL